MGDILTDLKVYGIRAANEAAQHRAQAKELRAEDFSAKFLGKGSEEYVREFTDRNRAEATQLEATAKAKDARALAAGKGLLLVRDPEELRDNDWSMTHSHLFAAAHRAGLVSDRLD
jgi:hypothetical protein